MSTGCGGWDEKSSKKKVQLGRIAVSKIGTDHRQLHSFGAFDQKPTRPCFHPPTKKTLSASHPQRLLGEWEWKHDSSFRLGAKVLFIIKWETDRTLVSCVRRGPSKLQRTRCSPHHTLLHDHTLLLATFQIQVSWVTGGSSDPSVRLLSGQTLKNTRQLLLW